MIRDDTIDKSPQLKKKIWKFTNEGWISYQHKLNKTIATNIGSLGEIIDLIIDTGEKHFKFEVYVKKEKTNHGGMINVKKL